jgi:uncharacterized membrane protein YkvA (DUF1232 family)
MTTSHSATTSVAPNVEPHSHAAAAAPRGVVARFVEDTLAKRLGQRHLVKLALDGGRVTKAWRELPDRMHLVANQTKLVMELVDDFRSGAYRKIPWLSLAVGAAAVLYAASPADVVPDVIVGLGMLDDIEVAALAVRFLRNDLKAYCEFKGYRVEDYFPAS